MTGGPAISGGARRTLAVALVLLVVAVLLGALAAPTLPWSGRAPWFAAGRAAHAAAAAAWLVLGSLGLALALRSRRPPGATGDSSPLVPPATLWWLTGAAFVGLDVLAHALGWLTAVDPEQLARLVVGALRLPAWGLALAWLAASGATTEGAGATTGRFGPRVLRGSALLFWVTTASVATSWVAAVLPGPVTDAARLTTQLVEGAVAALVLVRAAGVPGRAADGGRALLVAGAGWAAFAALLDAALVLPPLAAARSTATSLGILMAAAIGASSLPLLAAVRAALGAPPGGVLRPRALDLALAACVITLLAAGSVQGAASLRGWDPATARAVATPWLDAFDVAGILLAVAIAAMASAVLGRPRPKRDGSRLHQGAGDAPPVDAPVATAPTDAAPTLGRAQRTLPVGALIATVALIPIAIHGRDVELPATLVAALPAGVDEPSERGRRQFVAQGCWSCHLPDRAAAAGAPDLARQGGVRSAGWHALHLDQPSWARANSLQPPAPWLFTRASHPAPGQAPELGDDGRALVAYLLRLQRLPARRAGTPPGSFAAQDMAGGADDAFRMYCSRCHGTEGHGDGPATAYLAGESQPRALTRGAFRVRSTTDGPTRDDVLATLRHGLPGTAMPDFAHLPEATLEALVDYVLELGGIEPATPVPLPAAPPSTPTSIRRGEQLAASLDCASCHGPELAGATANELGLAWTDEVGRPLPRAPDVARDPAKGGASPEALYRTLFVGQEGSPMPSYEAAVPDPADRWALVHFLRDLRERAEG